MLLNGRRKTLVHRKNSFADLFLHNSHDNRRYIALPMESGTFVVYDSDNRVKAAGPFPTLREAESAANQMNSKEGRKAVRGSFLKAVRNNDRNALAQWYSKAALNEFSGAEGGYLVPTDYSYELFHTIAEHSFIEPRACVVPMTSRETLCPTVNNVTAESAGASPFFGGWRFSWQQGAQGQTVVDFGATATAPFSQLGLTAWDLIGEIALSNQFMEDLTEEGEAQLLELAGRAAAWAKEYAFINGLGASSNQPLGLLNAPCAVAVARAGGSHIAQADVMNIAAQLLPLSWNHAIWACAPSSVADLFKITGFVPNEDPLGTEQGCAGSLLTRPVFISEKFPKLGNRGDLVFFDPSMYVVGNRMEATISMSTDGPGFQTNQTYLKVWIRCDGRPLMDAAVTLTDPSGSTQTNVSSVVLLAA